MENLFNVPKSYVCHLIATREFTIEFSPRNAQIAVKSAIFLPLWLYNLMDDFEKQ